MSNRVLSRQGAREVTLEEMDQVRGATGCFITACGAVPHFVADDTRCDL